MCTPSLCPESANLFFHLNLANCNELADAKLPKVAIKAKGDGVRMKFRTTVTANDDNTLWEIADNDYPWNDTYNDGEYHDYQIQISPTILSMTYDDLVYVNESGSWNR